jgi:hypothetical protein
MHVICVVAGDLGSGWCGVTVLTSTGDLVCELREGCGQVTQVVDLVLTGQLQGLLNDSIVGGFHGSHDISLQGLKDSRVHKGFRGAQGTIGRVVDGFCRCGQAQEQET